ncbi:MAG TPA: hypothetical protein VEJ20_01400, partial [Candidatus Eremiobacteraceae bacterium]|nr:hypothetical protein [Candidatus Eremiobacteraceae bacterium]
TGQLAPLQFWSGVTRAAGWPKVLDALARSGANDRGISARVRGWAAAGLARAAYYEELASAGRTQ